MRKIFFLRRFFVFGSGLQIDGNRKIEKFICSFYLFQKLPRDMLSMTEFKKISVLERSFGMSGGEIAALIAAIAFAVLVVFVIRLLAQVQKTVASVSTTVEEANKTIRVVTKDVDVLTSEVEGLLVKTNTLLNDVNGKVATIDPLFTAVADLSESISDLNRSGKNAVAKLGAVGKTTAQATVAGKVGQTALKFFNKQRANSKSE